VQRDIRILTNLEAIARRAAQEFVQAATSAVSERGSFRVALAGGSTPKALYSLLVGDAGLRAQLPWDKMHLYLATNATSVRTTRTATFAWPPKH